MPYVELHACSAFSFLRGASFPEQLAETAAGVVALLGSAGCQPAVCGSLPQTSLGITRKSNRSVRQAAGRCRLAACAPQNSAERAQSLIDVFGRDNLCVEIQRHFLRGED